MEGRIYIYNASEIIKSGLNMKFLESYQTVGDIHFLGHHFYLLYKENNWKYDVTMFKAFLIDTITV